MGERTAESQALLSVLFADPEGHGHNAEDIGAQLSCLQRQPGAAGHL